MFLLPQRFADSFDGDSLGLRWTRSAVGRWTSLGASLTVFTRVIVILFFARSALRVKTIEARVSALDIYTSASGVRYDNGLFIFGTLEAWWSCL